MPGRLFDQPKYLLHPAAPVPSCPNTVARWGKGGGVDVGGRGSQRSGLSSKRSIPMVQLSYLSHRMDNSVAMRRDGKGWEGKGEGEREGKGAEGPLPSVIVFKARISCGHTQVFTIPGKIPSSLR